MKVCVWLTCFLGVALGLSDIRVAYKTWLEKYHPEEGSNLHRNPVRYSNFAKTYREVQKLNSEQEQWKAGLNLFADMTIDERSAYLGLKNLTEFPEEVETLPPILSSSSLPNEKFYEMGSVVNQGSCGSCWAFAAVAALEGHLLLHHNEYRELSEQYLLDCTYQRDGCQGGHSTTAINTAYKSKYGSSDTGYLPLRKDLTYRKNSDNGRCLEREIRATPLIPNALTRVKPRGVHVGSYQDDGVTRRNLATRGPLVVYIYASWALQLYLLGTFNGVGCGTNPTPNHAVTATGYAPGYWHIKNSWGTWWGRGGYLHLSRGWSNLCSVSAYNIIPQWNVNRNYDICRHTHPDYRSQCVDDKVLGKEECESKGCCYDNTYAGTLKACFTKAMVTVSHGSRKRVHYGSSSTLSLPGGEATRVQVNEGTFVVYDGKHFDGSRSAILKKGQSLTQFRVKSFRSLATKNVITLFEHFDYKGHKATLSQDNDKLQHVSSLISDGRYKVCTSDGRCETVDDASQQPKTLICNDCIRSVEFQ